MPHFLKINQFCFAYSFYWIPIDPGHRFRFVLKKWPPSSGLGGRHASESLAILFRIPWLPCPGLCSRVGCNYKELLLVKTWVSEYV